MTTTPTPDTEAHRPTERLDPVASHGDHDLLEHIEERWEDAPGLIGFFTTVDHKRIGIRYIVTAFVFFSLAGVMALVMRAQLAQPEGEVVGPRPTTSCSPCTGRS